MHVRLLRQYMAGWHRRAHPFPNARYDELCCQKKSCLLVTTSFCWSKVCVFVFVYMQYDTAKKLLLINLLACAGTIICSVFTDQTMPAMLMIYLWEIPISSFILCSCSPRITLVPTVTTNPFFLPPVI